MKILHIGVCVYPNESSSLTKAFKKQCTEYKELTILEAQRTGPEVAASFKPDFVFLQLQDDVLPIQIVQKIKQHSGFVINWTGDVRQPLPNWYQQMSKVVDCTGFTNNADIEVIRKLGHRAEFIQQGFDPGIYSPVNRLKDIDIVFMANNYINQFPLSKFRKGISLALTRYPNFKLYGTGWKFGHGNLNHSQQAEAKVYNQSKIGINISHFDLERYSSDRMTRIMGCGVLCFTHAYKGLEIDFIDGVHLVAWNNVSDLKEKINYYLANDKEGERIAKAGHREVQKFTFDKQVENLLKLCE